MDLIYTNAAREEQGVLQAFELDMAFGADENDFECTVTARNHVCENGSLLYFEGTEYGGMVDSIESNTATDDIVYSGRTWHGILNSKVLEPDSGKDYLVLTGEANAVLASLVARMGLSELFSASTDDSGLTISSFKMNRYITGYDGIVKMLESVGGKLKIIFQNGIAVLSAHPIHDYTQDEEFDSDLVPFQAKKNYKSVNHLVCLGAGELASRLVVHLYADAAGNISEKQTFTGLDEITAIFEYSNIDDRAELVSEGMDKFKGILSTDEISIGFDAASEDFDVGDIIGAVDHITGLSAHTTIKKKVLSIKNGQMTISLEPDTARSGSTYEGGGGGSGGGSVASSPGFRPNLLDNWYFRNPVNQRGQTNYAGTGYTIDRWRTNFSGDTVVINEDGITNTSASAVNGWHFYQILAENLPEVGSTVTASFLVASCSGDYLRGIISFRDADDAEIESAAAVVRRLVQPGKNLIVVGDGKGSVRNRQNPCGHLCPCWWSKRRLCNINSRKAGAWRFTDTRPSRRIR